MSGRRKAAACRCNRAVSRSAIWWLTRAVGLIVGPGRWHVRSERPEGPADLLRAFGWGES